MVVTFPKNIGELPEELTMRVLRMVGEDPLFELAAIVKGTDATPEQIATHAVRLVFESGWRGRMSVQTRDQVKCEVENHFRPPEGPAVDPIAESAQRGYDCLLYTSPSPRD